MKDKPTKGSKITIGYQVGKLTVTEPTASRKNGFTIWRCACSCGGEILLDTRTLQRGTVRDCGCTTRVAPGQKDLTGMRFGMLTCLEPTTQRGINGATIWRCKCACGNECFTPLTQLRSGYKKSCGCLSHPPLKDWIGKRFGKLTVLSYAGKKNGSHYWQCKCDCGNDTIVSQSNLKIGHTTSCGCSASDNMTLHRVDGTCLEHIRSKTISSVNTSGVRGVYLNKRTKKWTAQITFKGKTKYLGAYAMIGEAASARRKAEERYFGECLEEYADLLVNIKEPTQK